MKKGVNYIKKMLNPKAISKKLAFMMRPKNMNKILLLIAVLLVLYAVHKYFFSKEGFSVNADAFEEEKMENSKTFVLFYADWCGHCKKVMPVWDKVSETVNGSEENEGKLKMVKVECGSPDKNESHKNHMKKYDIKGYPTIKMISDDKAEEYKGGRTESDFLKFLGLA